MTYKSKFKYLDNLNPIQRKAVKHIDGPAVVFAGAGSGKTRIITTRIAYLIDIGICPHEILAVTFTNKAANEMKERAIKLNPEAKNTLISTFHAACARWLREFAEEIGYSSHFVIYDTSDSISLLKKIIKSLTKEANVTPLTNEMYEFINFMKTKALLPIDLKNNHNEFILQNIPHGGIAVYEKYQEELAKLNAMDFGDLLLNIILLLRRNERVRKALQNRYRYIMVDEYQDTNQAQFEIISILCEKHHNLFVVGDDDQSIYSWRGATPQNILNFDILYPNAIKITMEENYRCSKNIIIAANALISHNEIRHPKNLYSNIDSQYLIEYRVESNAENEAQAVAEQINKEQHEFSYDDVAIFYRINSQSRALEDALLNLNIPYNIYGCLRFYDRAEIKDIIAYLRLIINPSDDISLVRIINVPSRGIGPKILSLVEDIAKKENISLFESCKILAAANMAKISTKVNIFVETLNTIKAQMSQLSLDSIVGELIKIIDYQSYLKNKFPDQYLDKMENVYELINVISQYAERNENATLSDWLESISLNREEDKPGQKGVSLMTLHMAKGLEFRRVYIVGVEEGLLPYKANSYINALLEEERRLFYVGMTRAKEKLTILNARTRYMYNSIDTITTPSRFLSELPKDYIHVNTKKLINKIISDNDYNATLKCSSEVAYFDDFKISDIVIHPTYGKGIITNIQNELGCNYAYVKFEDFGIRYVKLRHLNIVD